MSTASIGIRASKPGIPNPPGIPPEFKPIPIGPGGIEFEVAITGAAVVAEIVLAPWNKGGGLLFRRVSAGTNSTEIRSKATSIPLVMATFTAGTTVAVYVEDLQATGGTYAVNPADIGLYNIGILGRGNAAMSPPGVLTGPQPGAQSFLFTSTGNDVAFFRWFGQLGSSTTRARLSYIGWYR